MFFTYLRRELRRRRKAALVVALGLALGIALVITVTSVSTGMKQAQGKVLQSLYGLGTDMTVTKAASPPTDSSSGRPRFNFSARSDNSTQSSDRVMVQGFESLDSTVVSQVSRQSGVAEAVGGLNLRVIKINGQFDRGQLQQNGSGGSGTNSGTGSGGRTGGYGGYGGFGGGGGSPTVQGGGAQFDVNSYTAYGVDVTRTDLGPLTSSKITSGTGFTSSETNADVAIVDSAYAKENSLSVGGTLTISGTNFKIIGVATADSGDSAADVYLPLGPAQTLASAQNKVTTIYVRATDSQKINGVKSAIQQNVPGTTVTTSADLASTVSGSLSTASNLASTVGRWLSIVVLLAAFLVAGLLTSSAVSRRVREFGTLKALGWKSGRVTRQVMGEALVNGLIGGVLGIGIGVGAAYLITSISPTLTAQLGGTGGGGGGGGFGGLGRRAVGKTLQIAMTAPVSVTTIGIAVALAIAGGLIAGTFGGWRASRLRPADALRRVE